MKRALELLRTPNSNTPAPDAPQGSILKNFQDFNSKKTIVSYPRSEDSKPGSIEKVSVLPFYFGGADDKQTLVPFSQRVDDESSLDGVQSACNHVQADVENHLELRGFIPAKATVTVLSGTTSQETSKITGIRYQKRNGKSYTLPYGASNAEKAEGNVRADIVAAVNALGNAAISFTSEKI